VGDGLERVRLVAREQQGPAVVGRRAEDIGKRAGSGGGGSGWGFGEYREGGVGARLGILVDGRLVATGTPDALRSELSYGGTITVEVERVPADHGLGALDGVQSISIDGSTVSVALAEPSAKAPVVTRLAEQTRVRDIRSEDASLEALFDAYTSVDRAATARSHESLSDPPEVSV